MGLGWRNVFQNAAEWPWLSAVFDILSIIIPERFLLSKFRYFCVTSCIRVSYEIETRSNQKTSFLITFIEEHNNFFDIIPFEVTPLSDRTLLPVVFPLLGVCVKRVNPNRVKFLQRFSFYLLDTVKSSFLERWERRRRHETEE